MQKENAMPLAKMLRALARTLGMASLLLALALCMAVCIVLALTWRTLNLPVVILDRWKT